ncbi:MAG: PfaD family polyunsaturated fatty acid/polyketide biosynthesis protein [Myxococcota bacterium]
MAAALPSIGTLESPRPPAFSSQDLLAVIPEVRSPIHIVQEGPGGRVGVALGGTLKGPGPVNGVPTWSLLATLPPLYPEWLGDRAFTEVHGLRFPYIAGAMANGIATTDLVVAMAKAGMLGFFGAAGLTVDRISRELDDLQARLGGTGLPWGSNLIHAPNEPQVEAGTVELYLKKGVKRVSASAYMALTPMIIRYAYSGIKQLADGRIHRENFVFAKISRPEVARRFLTPAPAEILDKLVASGQLTAEEGQLARRLPVAEDIIVESDSGGHTDNRPLTALFPVIQQLRNQLAAEHRYTRPIRVGAAGGLGTPDAVAAAFGLGAAFVLTGSVNQGAIESGLDPYGRELLAQAGIADVVMAPAADMFELGVTVQVLRRGTMFGVRAQKLYELYQAYGSLDAIPADEKKTLETQVLQMTCDEVWKGCEAFFAERDPKELEKAAKNPRHKMALVFRWYLGLSSKWAIHGTPERRMDYQIWCGPAMGAFNEWVRGSFLEPPQNRTAVQIARNLLEGAAVITRAQQLRTYGVPVPAAAFSFAPRPLA